MSIEKTACGRSFCVSNKPYSDTIPLQPHGVARALGEYGATSMLIGYTPGRTATVSTTVYQLWRTNDERGALFWVLVNLGISAVVLLTVNLMEERQKAG